MTPNYNHLVSMVLSFPFFYIILKYEINKILLIHFTNNEYKSKLTKKMLSILNKYFSSKL